MRDRDWGKAAGAPRGTWPKNPNARRCAVRTRAVRWVSVAFRGVP